MPPVSKRHFLAAALLAACPVFAQAQAAWPSQTIKLVVPFTPGTGMDTIARSVAPILSDRLGQPVVVQNVPGASGNIGAGQVATAAPDGYTLLLTANTMLIAAQLYKSVPFNAVKDFTPVSMAAYGTLMLVSNPKSGIQSMQDLITRSKAQPQQVSYGSPGVGTPHHMSMELLKSRTGASLMHVPYKGTAGYVQDLLAGTLETGFLPVHVAQGFVQGGRLNALAVGSPKRHRVAPNVPTIQESGAKDLNVDMWYAFFLPAGAPQPVVARLHKEIDAILKLPEVGGVLSKAGLDASSSTPAELAQVVNQDYQRWGDVIRQNAISAE